MSMVKRRVMPKAKRYAEGGAVKSKFNDTDWMLSALSPAYAIQQVASGDAKLSDLGLMGLMNGRFSGDKAPALTPEEERQQKMQALAAPGAPMATAAPVAGYKKGGAVSRAKPAPPRGNGKAKTGLRKGKMR
jgi:hypothetical protein